MCFGRAMYSDRSGGLLPFECGVWLGITEGVHDMYINGSWRLKEHLSE